MVYPGLTPFLSTTYLPHNFIAGTRWTAAIQLLIEQLKRRIEGV